MQHATKSKRTICIFAVTFIAIMLVFLWMQGMFYIVERQSSPNGKITTTVYRRDVSGMFPASTGFTIKDRGAFNGTRVYSDGSTFEDLWWSPCSGYAVIATMRDGARQLELKRYEKSSIANLNAYINMGLSSQPEFVSMMTSADWDTLEFDFIQWMDTPASMKVGFEWTRASGSLQRGTLVYQCETGLVSALVLAGE